MLVKKWMGYIVKDMKKKKYSYLFKILFASLAIGTVSCDSSSLNDSKNSENKVIKYQVTNKTSNDSFYYDDNSIININECFSKDDSQIIGYYKNNKLNNINDLNNYKVESNSTLNLADVSIITETGASINKVDDLAIRFKGKIKASDVSKYEIKEFGMLLAKTDYIANKDFIMENCDNTNMFVAKANHYLLDSFGYYYFYVSNSNITGLNVSEKYSARSYFKVDYQDGSSSYFYSSYDESKHSRSCYDVAKASYELESDKEHFQEEYLNRVIDINKIGLKANDSSSYTIDSVSYSSDKTIMYLTVSNAKYARCLIFDGAYYYAKQGTIASGNTLAMYNENDKLQVVFVLPKRNLSMQEGNKEFITNSLSDYKILVTSSALTYESSCASELQSIIKESTGCTLEITSNYDPSTSKYISLGKTKFKQESGLLLNSYTSSQGGFKILSYKDGVVIDSNEQYGLYYGMYRFLELNFGYKYYAYDCYKLASNKTVKLNTFNYEDYPDFKYRSLYDGVQYTASGYFDSTYKNLSTDGAYESMHLYDTGSVYQIMRSGNNWRTGKYGYGAPPYAQLDDISLLSKFVPTSSYYSSHPEWYYSSDGTASGVKQICFYKAYSDETLYNVIKNSLINIINSDYTITTNKSIYQIGIGDNTGYCTCSNCQELYNTYGKSGTMLLFGNKLASDIKVYQQTNYPTREIYLMFYGYQSFKDIPKNIKANDNIIIRLCPIEADYELDFSSSNNTSWYTLFEGWKKVASNITIWDYRSNYLNYLRPINTWNNMESIIRYYNSIGAKEIYSQGYHLNAVNPSFGELDSFVRSRLMWNSTLNYSDLEDEFLTNYYKDASSYVKQYIDKLNTVSSTKSISKTTYSLTFTNKIKTYLDNATNSTTDSNVKERIERLSLFYRYLQIKYTYSGADKTTFRTLCEKYGIERIERGVTLDNFLS